MSDQVCSILERHHRQPEALLQILIDLQAIQGWLSPETLAQVAAGVGLPLSRVISTAGFYSFLYMQPVGRYRLLFSDNITDQMAGSRGLMDRLCKNLWLQPGTPSEDGLVSVDTTSCTGLCDQGPALLINGIALPRLDAHKIDQIGALIRSAKPVSEWPTEWFEIHNPVHRRDALLSAHPDSTAVLQAALHRGADGILNEIERSGLRGRGGAGFATHIKWRTCSQANGATRYVVCNADEGEPGTFKDRVILSTAFDAVIDGMCVAALAVGARQGFIYLRAEYTYLRPRLQQRLDERRRSGLLGSAILGSAFDFDISIHLGAGAYVCGEESALIESLEGKPGKPRTRPPFPVTHGYLGQPTVVNNVETFALASGVALNGADWLRSRGTPQSSGTKVLSVSGDVQRPGVYEYPFGVTMAQVLSDAGAHDVQAVATAGAAGSILAPHEFERRIAFEDVSTGGSLMVFNHSRDMFELARNFTRFFAHESCGFCTPCRVGTAVNQRLIEKMTHGRGSPYDLEELDKMHSVMHGASHCGLGNTATIALQDLLHKFRPAFERRLASTAYEPAFDLDAELSQARRITGRDDAGAHLSANRQGNPHE